MDVSDILVEERFNTAYLPNIKWTHDELRCISSIHHWSNMHYDLGLHFRHENKQFRSNNGQPTGSQLLRFIRNTVHHFGTSFPQHFSCKQEVSGYFDHIFENFKFEVHDLIFKNHESIRAHSTLAKYR